MKPQGKARDKKTSRRRQLLWKREYNQYEKPTAAHWIGFSLGHSYTVLIASRIQNKTKSVIMAHYLPALQKLLVYCGTQTPQDHQSNPLCGQIAFRMLNKGIRWHFSQDKWMGFSWSSKLRQVDTLYYSLHLLIRMQSMLEQPSQEALGRQTLLFLKGTTNIGYVGIFKICKTI